MKSSFQWVFPAILIFVNTFTAVFLKNNVVRLPGRKQNKRKQCRFNICLGVSHFFPPNRANKWYFMFVLLRNIQTGRYSTALWNTLKTCAKLKAERLFEVDHKLKCPRNLLSIGPYVHSRNKQAFGVYVPQSNRWLLNGIYIHSNKIRLIKDNAACCNVNGTDCRIKCLWKQGRGSIKS